MYKGVLFIAIIFMSVVLLPCAEEIPDSNVLVVKQASHEHCDFGDLCSPLCTCQCCPSQWVGFSQIIVFNVNSSNIGLPQGFSSKYEQLVLSIWDPPKIA
jgi:hypothetical protein